MTWYNAAGASNCEIDFADTTVRQNFDTFTNSSCDLLAGTPGNAYDFACTVRYQDANSVEHAVRGTCEGLYEEA